MSGAPGAAGPATLAPRPDPGSPEVRVVGVPRAPVRDIYHAFLRASWPVALSMLVGAYVGLNVAFALVFAAIGGVANAAPGSVADAFFFSIQTMGTIGYGTMYPTSRLANVVVSIESVFGLMATALATGLLFAKFSRSTARIAFTRLAAIAPMDGVPTLMFRVGNERDNQIMEAQLRAVMIKTEHTAEGMLFYRLYDLALVRDRSLALTRSWTVMHQIVEGSPLFGHTPASLKANEIELLVALSGVDDTSLQPVHARVRYTDGEIVWGARHADVLNEEPDGSVVLDVRKFHDLVPTQPTPGFPYPAPAEPGDERPAA
jgi:inward rectifier potassium channel